MVPNDLAGNPYVLSLRFTRRAKQCQQVPLTLWRWASLSLTTRSFLL